MPALIYQTVVNTLDVVHRAVLEMKTEFDNIRTDQVVLKTFVENAVSDIRIMLSGNTTEGGSSMSGMLILFY